MKIFKLLEGLYLELRYFNEHIEYFALIEREKRLNQANPMRPMNYVEKKALKRWINKNMETKGIGLDYFPADNWLRDDVERFLELPVLRGREPTRRAVAVALGYGSFQELLAAYRKETGGVA